jgi:hypothetical protein
MGIVIDLDISDIESAWRGEGMRGLNAGIATAVREACLEGAKEAVNTHLYQDRTTQLTASIHGDEAFILTDRGAEGQITAGEEYASYVDAWESGQVGESFMDRAATKAETVLTAGIDEAAEQAGRRFNAA